MGTNADKRIDELARRQLGVFTRWQALSDCGMPPSTLARRLRSGRWLKLHPGVYALVSTPDTSHQRILAAVLAADPIEAGAVASHLTAAALWELGDVTLDPPYHVVVPGGSERSVRHTTIHEFTTLRSVDCACFRRVPLTAVPRTVVDSAGLVELATAEDLLVEAFRRRLATPGKIRAVLERVPNGPGTGGLRRLLRNFDPDEARRLMSRAETAFLVRVVRRHRLPAPQVNRTLRLPHGGLVAKLDFRWPAKCATVEVDGLRFHSTPRQKLHDDQRQNALVLSGERILRYSARTVFQEPERVAAEVASLLDHRTTP